MRAVAPARAPRSCWPAAAPTGSRRSPTTSSGGASADVATLDLVADDIEARARELRARFGEPDEIVIAYGVLGNQAAAEREPSLARGVLDANLNSAVVWTLAY